MKPEERKEKLLKLASEMANKGELKITPECAEYQLLDYLLTDDELAVMSEMKLVMPSTARGLAKKTGMPVDKVKRILENCADNARDREQDREKPEVERMLAVRHPELVARL